MAQALSLFFEILVTDVLKAFVVWCLEVLKIPVVAGWVAGAQHL